MDVHIRANSADGQLRDPFLKLINDSTPIEERQKAHGWSGTSWEWNEADRASRLTVSRVNGDHEWSISRAFSSWALIVKACATEVVVKFESRLAEHWVLQPGSKFVAFVPKGWTGKLVVHFADGNVDVDLGTSARSFGLRYSTQEQSADGQSFLYEVNTGSLASPGASP
jgi:hypothetical protein